VHRDLDALVQSGQALKVHGGVKLAAPSPLAARSMPICHLCQAAVPDRTAFVVHTAQGQVLDACCPHCGLVLMSVTEGVVSALAKDFIYGRMVNCWQATCLVECEISICCAPSVLCFSSLNDAARFQSGFGGRIMAFGEAQHYLVQNHRGLS